MVANGRLDGIFVVFVGRRVEVERGLGDEEEEGRGRAEDNVARLDNGEERKREWWWW